MPRGRLLLVNEQGVRLPVVLAGPPAQPVILDPDCDDSETSRAVQRPKLWITCRQVYFPQKLYMTK